MALTEGAAALSGPAINALTDGGAPWAAALATTRPLTQTGHVLHRDARCPRAVGGKLFAPHLGPVPKRHLTRCTLCGTVADPPLLPFDLTGAWGNVLAKWKQMALVTRLATAPASPQTTAAVAPYLLTAMEMIANHIPWAGRMDSAPYVWADAQHVRFAAQIAAARERLRLNIDGPLVRHRTTLVWVPDTQIARGENSARRAYLRSAAAAALAWPHVATGPGAGWLVGLAPTRKSVPDWYAAAVAGGHLVELGRTEEGDTPQVWDTFATLVSTGLSGPDALLTARTIVA